jgi:DNA-directed RNA polymerase subunit E'/Rpb7
MESKFEYTSAFNRQKLIKLIRVKPHETNDRDITSILTQKLMGQVGDKCSKEGYIKKSSIQILQRTIGKINTRFLDGSINYRIIYSAEVCNPRPGDILKVQFVEKNKAGILAEKQGTPLNIVLPKDIHADKTLYRQVDSENETKDIVIQVLKTKSMQNTKVLYVVGKLVGLP